MIPYSHRRRASESRTEAEYTDTTNRSSTLLSRGGFDSSDSKRRDGVLSRIKNSGRRWMNRGKPLSEARLREKLVKRFERGDWGSVRKLISNFDFSDIPEPLLPCTKVQNISSSVQMIDEGPAHRRPSYGSRSGDRLSFTGKESAAAAAAIKAVLFEESSVTSSSEKVNIENVLHDICRYNPPLDVMETLLVSLRHRRGATSGTDDTGRTPLHVASASGASPDVIDALIRADPRPASEGDKDGRSPLHIAVRSLAYGATDDNPLIGTEQTRLSSRRNNKHNVPSNEEILAQAVKTVLLLKSAMLTYPGKIDFKDEDNSGFAPVDYALDGEDVTDEYLLHCLITRKHSSRRRRSMTSLASADTQLTSNMGQTFPRQVSGITSTSSQDIKVLHRLEEEEIRDRRMRLERMSRPKKQMKAVLFDVFGIDEHLECGPSEDNPPCIEDRLTNSDKGTSEKSFGAIPPKALRRSSEKSSSRPSPKLQDKANENDCRSMTDSAIYDRHLQAYLNDFAGDDGLEFYDDDDDDFDIHHDPEEDIVNEEELYYSSLIGEGKPPVFEINFAIDSMDDDNLSQCSYGRSVVSEVTVPTIR